MDKISRKLEYSICDVYCQELNDITNKLNDLEHGRIYEVSQAKMDGYLQTNILQLKTMFNELLDKIQNGKESTSEEIAKYMK